MAAKFENGIHTHFNAPKALEDVNSLLNGTEPILLVANGRVWFMGSYAHIGIDGLKQESPCDEVGSCICSLPADICNFFCEEEAISIDTMIAADDELLRRAS